MFLLGFQRSESLLLGFPGRDHQRISCQHYQSMKLVCVRFVEVAYQFGIALLHQQVMPHL